MNVVQYSPAVVRFDQTQCVICLDEYRVEERVAKLACDHIFHLYCWSEWEKKSAYCPTCRLKTAAEEGPEALAGINRDIQNFREIIRIMTPKDPVFFLRHLKVVQNKTALGKYVYLTRLKREDRMRFLELCLTLPYRSRFGSEEIVYDWMRWEERRPLAWGLVAGLVTMITFHYTWDYFELS